MHAIGLNRDWNATPKQSAPKKSACQNLTSNGSCSGNQCMAKWKERLPPQLAYRQHRAEQKCGSTPSYGRERHPAWLHASLAPNQAASGDGAHATLAAAAGETTALPLDGTPLSAIAAATRGCTCISSPSDVWMVAPCHSAPCLLSRQL